MNSISNLCIRRLAKISSFYQCLPFSLSQKQASKRTLSQLSTSSSPNTITASPITSLNSSELSTPSKLLIQHYSPPALHAFIHPFQFFSQTQTETQTQTQSEPHMESTNKDSTSTIINTQTAEPSSLSSSSFSSSPIGLIVLDNSVFGARPRPDLIHRTLRYESSWRLQGTESSKNLGQVQGTTRKPFPQKRRGKARQGSLRGPHFVGGRIIFRLSCIFIYIWIGYWMINMKFLHYRIRRTWSKTPQPNP
jgi:hypothetical protein